MESNKKFTPVKQSAQKYAFTGNVYLSTQDYQIFRSQGGSNQQPDSILVQIQAFILRALPLEELEPSQVAMNSKHREMLMLSMLDEVSIKIANVQDLNPLNEISTVVDVIQVKPHKDIEFEDGGLKQLQEDAIIAEIEKVYAQKPINAKERFIISLYDGKCILGVYVDKITGFNHKSS